MDEYLCQTLVKVGILGTQKAHQTWGYGYWRPGKQELNGGTGAIEQVESDSLCPYGTSTPVTDNALDSES